MFLVSLAISDLVVSSLVMPFAVGNDILGYWPFNKNFCNIWISFDILSATASILNLFAISLDRYIHMKNPFRYEEWMTTKKCLGFIAIIWFVSIIISFVPINLGLHKLSFSNGFTSEVSNLTTTVAPPIIHQTVPMCILELELEYAFISSSISFYIPCVAMVIVYIQIYRLARHHAKSIKQTQAFETKGKSKIAENKALFTLGMIMGLFLLSWIPFFVVNLISAFCVRFSPEGISCVPEKVFVAFIWLGYFNSTMNPIIYSKFNADFREAFKKILLCQRCRNEDPYRKRSRTAISIPSAHNRETNGRVVSVEEKEDLLHLEMTTYSEEGKLNDINDNPTLL